MMRSASFRVILVALAIVLVIVFPIGGGFGSKANTSLLNDVALAHFAHRGGSAAFPENSMEGIARSLSGGFTGVEIDIHETKDGVMVLFHDDSCDRQLGISGLIADKSWRELQPLNLRQHTQPTPFHVPRLDSVLARYSDSLLLYLDTKFSGLDQADSIAQLIGRYGAGDHVLVASSSVAFITYLEFHHPELNTVLEGFDQGEEWTWHLFLKNFRPDFVSSFAFEVDSAHVAWLRDHDLLANKFVYGLDSSSYARLDHMGITRFIVDDQ